MAELTQDFAEIRDTFGAPQGGDAVSEADVAGLRGKLPDAYLDFLVATGTGTWNDGYFQLRQPTDAAGVVKQLFAGDPDIRPDETFVLGWSAFGFMALWNTRHHAMTVNPILGFVSAPEMIGGVTSTPERAIYSTLIFADSDAYEALDDDGEGFFTRMREAYGPAPYGSIYAPKLWPALGGELTVDNFRIAEAVPALSLAVQAQRFRLYDAKNFRNVRPIGRG